jgi:phosphatidylglycerol:prolipoprotein diacylglycerol transferase
MLPNLYMQPIRLLGKISIQPFGILVATAVIAGYLLAKRRARSAGLDPEVCADGMFWAILSAFIFAHLTSEIFYYPDEVKRNPITLIYFWRGLSSFGGFFGAFLGGTLYFRRKHVPVMEYAEAILFGFVPGWVIGRLGCTIVFDHPGIPTHFLFAMKDLSGVVRHNLGFYEMILALIQTGILYGLRNRRPFKGFHFGIMMVIYGPARFFLDFLRVADKTYLSLTPGQYFSVILFLLGTWFLLRGSSRGNRSSLRD